MKKCRSERLTICGLDYHLRLWGERDRPLMVMLHGWMDVSASFQFLVDALADRWQVVAPDWRGCGLTEWAQGSYYFPDYLADLDQILLHYSAGHPVHLVGHSMGGNVAGLYAGIRPERVASLISLEGFGMPDSAADLAPARYLKWLDQRRESAVFKLYENFSGVEARLKKTNSNLTDEKAAYLAQHWARQREDGKVELLGDPRHKWTNPVLYRASEALACWRQIRAPVCWISAKDSMLGRWFESDKAEKARRMAAFRSIRYETVTESGHMLHHDQPAKVAQLIETFLNEI